MRRKNSEVSIPTVPIPASNPDQGVIDLDPQLPEGVVRSEHTVVEYTKPKRQYTRRAKTAKPATEKPLVNEELIYEKAVEAFRAFFNNEQTQEVFLARIGDLQALQIVAAKINQK